MTEQDNGVVSKCGLTSEEYSAIHQLAALCNQHDHITLKLNYSTLRSRPVNERNDFLYYVDGNLVGFLGLYQFLNHEIEISGMVHPNYRRKGIFTALLSEANREIRRRGVTKQVFINEKGSLPGKSFLIALGAQYSFSEYWMKMTQTTLPPMCHPIRLRPASVEDIEMVAHMTSVCFDMNETGLLESMTKQFERNNHFIIELSGEPIGTVAMNYPDESSAFIYGFCVLPDKQGRGYGRQALALAIENALHHHRTNIELEVACENSNALSLYQSCGFEVIRANDYYVKMLEC